MKTVFPMSATSIKPAAIGLIAVLCVACSERDSSATEYIEGAEPAVGPGQVACLTQSRVYKTWQVEQRIGVLKNGTEKQPQVASDVQGNTSVVWSITRPRGVEFVVTQLKPGLGWSTPAHLELKSAKNVFEFKIGIDNKGRVILVWIEWREAAPYSSVWSARFSDTRWEQPVRIDAGDSRDKSDLNFAINSNGFAIAVWSLSNTPLVVPLRVNANRYNSDQGWAKAENISPTMGSLHTVNPYVAINDKGQGVVSYYDATSGGWFWTRRYDPVHGWLQPERVDGPGAPKIALNNRGDMLLLWRTSEPATLWSKWTTFDQPWPSASAEVGPQGEDNADGDITFALDDEGQGIVAWTMKSSGSPHLVLRARAGNAKAWEKETQFLGDWSYDSTSPHVVFVAPDEGWLVWSQQDAAATHINAIQYLGNQRWTAPQKLEQQLGDLRTPQMTLDCGHNINVVWADASPTGTIWFNQYR